MKESLETNKWMENVISDCRNYLSSKDEMKRLAAVFIFYELAFSVPTVVSIHLPSIIRMLWSPIHDPKLLVRKESIKALRECFKLVLRRPQAFRIQFEDTFSRAYQSIGIQAKDAFLAMNHKNSKDVLNSKAKNKTEFEIHGSLLIFDALLECNDFILSDKFDAINATVVSLRYHKSKHVKQAIIDLIPKITKFFPKNTKSNKYLKEHIEYLMLMSKNKDLQHSCLNALADLCLVCNMCVHFVRFVVV